MTRVEKEIDEFGKRSLEPLRPTPPLDPKIIAEDRRRFLQKAENLREQLIPSQARLKSADIQKSKKRGWLSLPIYKALIAIILVFIFIAGSSFTVYAAQSSLPGEPLYTIKSVSEDIRLAMTFSTQSKLDLTLDFTSRRMGEIQTLVSDGKPLTNQTSDRYQYELEDALQLATELDDQQMQSALGKIKSLAESQGITVEELIEMLPSQASPAILRLRERLQEQVQLSSIGEKNPQAFRKEIKLRAQNRHGPKGDPTSELPEILPVLGTITPFASQEEEGKGNKDYQSTKVPGQGNQGNGQGQPQPGNGNHGPNPSHTPQP